MKLLGVASLHCGELRQDTTTRWSDCLLPRYTNLSSAKYLSNTKHPHGKVRKDPSTHLPQLANMLSFKHHSIAYLSEFII